MHATKYATKHQHFPKSDLNSFLWRIFSLTDIKFWSSPGFPDKKRVPAACLHIRHRYWTWPDSIDTSPTWCPYNLKDYVTLHYAHHVQMWYNFQLTVNWAHFPCTHKRSKWMNLGSRRIAKTKLSRLKHQCLHPTNYTYQSSMLGSLSKYHQHSN